MTDNAANGHTAQRITNAILGVKMDNLSDDVQDIKETLKDHCAADEKWRSGMDTRMRGVEIGQAQHEERIKHTVKDIKHTVRNTTGFNAAWATIAAVLAGIFGAKS